MPLISVNGTKVNYEEQGSGEPVLLVMGTGSPGHVWRLHQVAALVAGGYRAITFDNRGIAALEHGAPDPEIDDLVGDVIGLIQQLCGRPTRLVGVSMGAQVVQEVLLARPDLVSQAVLMATRGRPDAFRTALAESEGELLAADVRLPARYLAVMKAMQSLSPHTLNDEASARNWLDLLELFPISAQVLRAQANLETITHRLAAYRQITARCMVVAFEDDLITPTHLGREVADAITGSRYEVVGRCGHFGYLEQPEAVNALLLDFFRNEDEADDEPGFPAQPRAVPANAMLAPGTLANQRLA